MRHQSACGASCCVICAQMRADESAAVGLLSTAALELAVI